VLISSCGDSSSSDVTKVQVVAATPQVADVVRAVGGDRVDVKQALPNGTDPHSFSPKPSDVKALIGADLVVRSGGEVDAWMDELVKSAGSDSQQLVLQDLVSTKLELDREGVVDPHWWHNPQNVVDAARAVQDAIVDRAPKAKAQIDASAAAYIKRLKQFDTEASSCFDRLAPGERKLITTHDSLRYLADRYDLQVSGAAIDSLSTEAEPSAKSVQQLVEKIKAEKIQAIFPEQRVSQKLIDALANQAGVAVADPLWVDTLSPDGGRAETYLGAESESVENIVNGLSSGQVRCELKTFK